MAEKKVYLGSIGPFIFDDEDLVDDPDGDFSGETVGGLLTDGTIGELDESSVSGTSARSYFFGSI